MFLFPELSDELITEKPCLNRNEKITCENCGTETTKWIIARHKKRCSVVTIMLQSLSHYLQNVPGRFELPWNAQKESSVRANNAYKCKTCFDEDFAIWALRKHWWSQHGIGLMRSKLDMDILLENTFVTEIKKNPFFAFISSLTLSLKKKDTTPFFRHAIIEQLLPQREFWSSVEHFKKAAKFNFAFWLVLGNKELGTCGKFYADENNAVMERSKIGCAQYREAKTKEILHQMHGLVIKWAIKWTPNRNFRHLKTLQILQRYSKTYPWLVEVTF